MKKYFLFAAVALMVAACTITVTAYDADGNTLRQRVFDSVPVTRNRITTYQGKFFEDGDGEFTQTMFGFSVNGEWSGEDNYDF